MAVSDTFLKIRIWTNIIILAIVAIYTLLFLGFNYGERVELWLFFGTSLRSSMLLALLAAFVLGSLLTLLVRMIFTTVSQIRQSRDRSRSRQLEAEVSEMRTRSAQLQNQARK